MNNDFYTITKEAIRSVINKSDKAGDDFEISNLLMIEDLLEDLIRNGQTDPTYTA